MLHISIAYSEDYHRNTNNNPLTPKISSKSAQTVKSRFAKVEPHLSLQPESRSQQNIHNKAIINFKSTVFEMAKKEDRTGPMIAHSPQLQFDAIHAHSQVLNQDRIGQSQINQPTSHKTSPKLRQANHKKYRDVQLHVFQR